MTFVAASKWVRVNKRNPCPICGKPAWCLISPDGKAAICARTPSDKLAGNAGWLHKLDNNQRIAIPQPNTYPKQITPKADIEVVNAAYQTLINALALSLEDYKNLIARGLTGEQIKNLEYRTLPISDRHSIMQRLNGVNLDSVPGFWKDDTAGNHDPDKYHLAGQSGLLIPIRNLKRQIQGFQIRCSDGSSGRYRWLSSPNKPHGTSSGTPIHIAQPLQPGISEVWITEGPIKADIASLKLNKIILAVPGVGNYSGIFPILKELQPDRVVVAYDMDKLTNPTVNRFKNLVESQLKRMKFKTFEADWDKRFKGLDDLLVSGD
jgi:hypothetical protein